MMSATCSSGGIVSAQKGERARRIQDRRERRRTQIDLAHQDIAEKIVYGEMNIRDVDPSRVDMVQLEDDVAQIGQGRVCRSLP